MIAFLLSILIFSGPNSDRLPLLNIYLEAVEQINDGFIEESIPLLEEIYERMPDNNRALYNHGICELLQGNTQQADSIFSIFPESEFQSDTLLQAKSSSRLGNAMASGDYAGVQSVMDMLLPEVTTGSAPPQIIQNYEVAMKWLNQNTPPPPEDQENNEDQEDSENQEDNEDKEDNEDNEDQEDNEDENENENENENEDETEQPPPPSESEMTPEVAQMILDMVQEAEGDSLGRETGQTAIGAPNW